MKYPAIKIKQRTQAGVWISFLLRSLIIPANLLLVYVLITQTPESWVEFLAPIFLFTIGTLFGAHATNELSGLLNGHYILSIRDGNLNVRTVGRIYNRRWQIEKKQLRTLEYKAYKWQLRFAAEWIYCKPKDAERVKHFLLKHGFFKNEIA